MTIKYKFNKSSEARDCVVEGVELVEIKSEKSLWKAYNTTTTRGWSHYSAFLLEINKDNNLEKEKTKYDIKFTSPQQLKDFINTIQEPIEFIAESSIDDVLMKEWIGEWKYQNGCANKYCTYKEDSNCWDFNCCKHFIKSVGSPKLNSNWTFKIQ